MTGILVVGARNVSCTRDEDGHRNYTVNWLVRTDHPAKGPAYILAFWPLAAPGTPYLLSAVERDLWAFCTPELNISAHPDVTDGDPIQDWIVTQSFTTKPTWRCNTNPIENPLMEPWDINISYRHEQQEATQYWKTELDPQDGEPEEVQKPLLMANGERITGGVVEIKKSHLSIELTKNYAYIDVPLISRLLNTVNDSEMWGVGPREVLFADVRGERLAYGNCGFYWRMTFTFDINEETFDPTIPWWGSKVIIPAEEGADPFDPIKIEVPKNPKTAEAIGIVALKEDGTLSTDPESDIPSVGQHKEKYKLYKQDNHFLLGIPTDLVAGFTPPPPPPPPEPDPP